MLIGYLNAEKIPKKRNDELRSLLNVAFKLKILDSIPVYEYYFLNYMAKHQKSSDYRIHLDQMFKIVVTVSRIIEFLSEKYKSTGSKFNIARIKDPTQDDAVFYPRNRNDAIEHVGKWAEKTVDTYIKICDPYFTPDDLDILKPLLAYDAEVDIEILTSMEEPRNRVDNLKQLFVEKWKETFSFEPPLLKIIVVGTKYKKMSPIHDRCVLTKTGGIIFGTSISGLGNKDCFLTRIGPKDANYLELKIDNYLKMLARDHNSERLEYNPIVIS
ncbi:MAG: hypothetical protein WDO15_18345 [Bacteroidota bacterium]